MHLECEWILTFQDSNFTSYSLWNLHLYGAVLFLLEYVKISAAVTCFWKRLIKTGEKQNQMNMVVECVSLIFCNWSCTLKFWKMFPKDSHSMYHCNRCLQHPNVCVLLPACIIKVCVFPGPTTATATSNIWVFFLVACTHYKRLCLSRSNHCNKNPHHPSVFFSCCLHTL